MTTCDTNCQFNRPKQGCRETRRPPQMPTNAPKNEKPPTVEVHKPARFKRIASAVVADESTNSPTKLHETPRSWANPRIFTNSATNSHELPRICKCADESTNSHESTNVRGPAHGHTLHTSKATQWATQWATGGAWIEPAGPPPRKATEEERRPPRRITAPSSYTPSPVALVPCNSLPLLYIGAKKM